MKTLNHKQTGYQAAPVPGIGYLAILHGTPVLLVNEAKRKMVLNSGGYHTRSTVKAINGLLQDLGFDAYRAKLFAGIVVLEYELLAGRPQVYPMGHGPIEILY